MQMSFLTDDLIFRRLDQILTSNLFNLTSLLVSKLIHISYSLSCQTDTSLPKVDHIWTFEISTSM